MGRLLLVCAGGALGSGARYLVATWATAAFGPSFPRGTLIVNVTGSFLLAAILTLAFSTDAISDDLRLFLSSGVMGGYTTYSSFNWETIALVQEGRVGTAALNVAATLLGCLAAGMAGVLAVRWLGY
ncbi:MAG TPA: fluoride efflux transporter CrcB [Anaeromyxobacter sp.]|nr:fluoride efflux transporter CrcB [Anaeromyxobacter sp.]